MESIFQFIHSLGLRGQQATEAVDIVEAREREYTKTLADLDKLKFELEVLRKSDEKGWNEGHKLAVRCDLLKTELGEAWRLLERVDYVFSTTLTNETQQHVLAEVRTFVLAPSRGVKLCVECKKPLSPEIAAIANCHGDCGLLKPAAPLSSPTKARSPRDLEICARPKCESPRHYNIHDPARGGHEFVERSPFHGRGAIRRHAPYEPGIPGAAAPIPGIGIASLCGVLCGDRGPDRLARGEAEIDCEDCRRNLRLPWPGATAARPSLTETSKRVDDEMRQVTDLFIQHDDLIRARTSEIVGLQRGVAALARVVSLLIPQAHPYEFDLEGASMKGCLRCGGPTSAIHVIPHQEGCPNGETETADGPNGTVIYKRKGRCTCVPTMTPVDRLLGVLRDYGMVTDASAKELPPPWAVVTPPPFEMPRTEGADRSAREEARDADGNLPADHPRAYHYRVSEISGTTDYRTSCGRAVNYQQTMASWDDIDCRDCIAARRAERARG